LKIIVGSDHFGRTLLDPVIAHLKELNYEVVDIGAPSEPPVDYPDIAEELALQIEDSSFERGILICGTGIGMAIAANKIPGVRVACCHDAYSAARARMSNDAHILTMGAAVVGPLLANTLVDIWLDSEFSGGRSAPKVEKLKALDKKYRRAK